uniref:Tensin 3 n=1 Tax=Echeneis naucrates TaxID=173247 RepID=A0A665WUM4_ECHNA
MEFGIKNTDLMDKTPQIDLTFITERIISIFCPHECPEETYLQNLQKVIPMLQSKHGNNYLLINLSQKNAVLTQMNNEVLDTGWMDPLAPNLDQIYSMCATIDNWLQTNEKHVLVLHCRGGKGQLGVLVASYIHFSNMLASAGLSLDHFSMKRFYNDKLSALMTPSQKRYVWMLGSMLRGGLRMYPSPTFLLCVVLHRLPKIRPDGGKADCHHYNVHIVVCYDINSNSSSRQVVFRLQFHTGLVHRRTLTFLKPDLDCAIEDPRFPENGKVELLFSESPEKLKLLFLHLFLLLCQHVNLQLNRVGFVSAVASHVLDPVNGSLYSRVRKASCEEGVSMPLTTSSPSCSDQDLSASSNSGLSVASQGQTGAWHRRGNTQDKCTQARKLFPGLDFEIAKPLLEVMTELAAYGGREVEMSEDEIGLDHTMNGEGSSNERETDILDDEDEVDDMAASALDIPSSISIDSLSSENLPETQKSTQAEYSTHSWVRQQQMLEAITENYIEVDAEGRLIKVGKERPSSMEAPDTPKRGISSREAVQRRILDEHGSHQNTDNAHNPQLVQTNSSSQEEGLVSLTTDIDESLEQLNQLILDLDPTFVPVPTRLTPLPRCASSHTNETNPLQNLFLFLSSATPPPVWHDMTPNSLNSPYPPQPSAPLSLSIPNAHSSPRGALKSLGGGPGVCRETDISDLSLLLSGAGGLDHSLLEAVEGLGTLNLRGNGGLAPQLPEKKRWGEGGELGSQSPSLSGFSSPHSGSSLSIPFSSPMTPDHLRGQSGAPSPGDTVKFVQDTSKFWYKPDISRDQAIAVLKDREPGSFIVRDSHSFRGAYGLAMKVATPPPSVLQQSKKVGDLSNELVRHFLIECTQKGVRLKGCPNEPYFGSLTALVCQHSITPLALPCKLILPDKDPAEELNDSSAQTATNSAAELLKQGAACNVWYLGSVELESLTGHQAVQKATTVTLSMDPLPASTVVHFKVSAQGITLTDNQRKLFFRRHYAVNTVIFCSLDPQGRKIFGFIARKSQSETENMCHLFAEHDPEQPASAIVNFVSKVMIGSHKK